MLLRVLCAVGAPVMRRLHEAIPAGMARLEGVAGSPWSHLARSAYDLCLLDRQRMGGQPLAFLERLRAEGEATEAIILTRGEDSQERAALLAAGALAVLPQALDDPPVADALRALLQRRRDELVTRLRNHGLRGRHGLADFVSDSPVMQRFLSVARKVTDSDSSVLILGETGVGKERLARAMHEEGPRAGGPFLAVHCGALPEPLLESELFGHEQGAFTGAVRSHRGYFELAHGGTLFLDEVGEMAPAVQVRLLRALQERCIRPIGAESDLPVDVRLMAATNRDLQREVRAGRFRADLYYRLAVVALTIPPLRERREDLVQLTRNHLEELGRRFQGRVTGIAEDAMAAMRRYDWPGNVRELVNVLERAVLLSEGPTIGLQDLPEAIARREDPGLAAAPPDLMNLPLGAAVDQMTRSFERAYLDRLLRENQGRVGATAARAGLSERALWTKMQRLGLRKEDYRAAAAP